MESKAIEHSQSLSLKTISPFACFTKLAKRAESDPTSSLSSDKRRDLIHIQWFVAIACSYLLIVENGQVVQDSSTLFLLIMPLGSIAVILRLPESVFEHRYFPACMVVVDTLLFFVAIIFNRQSPWDLCLIFFFGMLIAAMGENLIQIIIGSLIIGIISVLIVPLASDGNFEIHSNTLLRIPLLFGASLVYGHLADQVKRERKKTAQLEEMRRQQLSTKDAFISHVSHELRTPLTAIYQFVTILSDGLAGDLNEQQREYIEIVQRNVKQLQAMVSDLLDTARADNGKLTIDPRAISLQTSMHEVLTNHRASAAVKSITLSAQNPNNLMMVYADPQRIKQVLSNLIDNAIKFTPPRGNITVKAQIVEADQGFVRVSVSDTGCGIRSDAVQSIFDRLYQEESMLNTNRKGLGLGLHICRELVSRQGGRIWVESDLGKGSAFHFTLPAFSLSRILGPLVEQTGGFATGLSIISVKVEADGQIEASEIGKAMWGEKWDRLTHFTLPTGALLLPRMTMEGKSERFFVLSPGDAAKAHQMALRIEKEVGGNRRTYDGKCGIKTSVIVMDSLREGNADMEALTGELSRRILNLAGLSNLRENKSQLPSANLSSPVSRTTESSPEFVRNDA